MTAVSWQACWEHEQEELARSQRVQKQLEDVLQTMVARCQDAEAQNAKLCSGLREAQVETMESEAERASEANADAEARLCFLENEMVVLQQEHQDSLRLLSERRRGIERATSRQLALEQECSNAESRLKAAAEESRSLVTEEALERGRAEAVFHRQRLQESETETARLREALADSWASRDQVDSVGVCDLASDLQALDDVEDSLRSLADQQKTSASEVHRVQKLERTEMVLQAQLRGKSEEHAELKSARVDLGDTGQAMREALASQSEGHVTRIDKMAEQRRVMDQDRARLQDEIADLQARITCMAPELENVRELKLKHDRLDVENQAFINESTRLQAMNSAFGAQLLGEALDDGTAAVSEAVSRLLTLQSRLCERREKHCAEKQKLADKIRTLERGMAQGIAQDAELPRSSTTSTESQGAWTSPGSLGTTVSGAKTAFQSGLSMLRKTVS
uniref:Uncharacterized protein n=1 Tax=Noctiluca scintillans TaxID=2966 RepID=A0A7S1F324_NOCSC